MYFRRGFPTLHPEFEKIGRDVRLLRIYILSSLKLLAQKISRWLTAEKEKTSGGVEYEGVEGDHFNLLVTPKILPRSHSHFGFSHEEKYKNLMQIPP